MVEGLKSVPRLNVLPPLRLKDLGVGESHLIMLSEGTSDYILNDD